MKFQKPDFNTKILPPKLRILTLEVEKLDNDLNGVCYKNGKRYVVPGALPGDVVKAAVVENFGNVVCCGMLALVRPSDKRTAPKCRYYDSCGGCNFMITSPENELAFKTELIRRRLFQFGTEVSDTVWAKGFRNKITLAFEKEDGKLKVGFMDDKTKKVTDVTGCLMHDVAFSDLVKAIRFWVEDNDISVYNPKFGTGALRFVVARYLYGQLAVTVVGAKHVPALDDLYKKLRKRFSKVGIFLNENANKTNEAIVGQISYVTGEKSISGEMLGVKFSLTPQSFFQTNEAVCERIYSDVEKLAKEIAPDVIYDLYCGIGITTALFSKTAKKVVGVEIVPEAAKTATELLAENGVTNAQIVSGDAAEALEGVKSEGRSLVFVDPPRRGLAEAADKILGLSPDFVIYLSCNPNTLVKDLQKFSDNGYKAVSATPYNMFRATRNVETLTLLEKIKHE